MSKQLIANDIDFQISFYEAVIRKSPNFVEALAVLGDLYTKKGFLEKGLDIDRKLSVLRPDDPVVFYNLACSYSLLNDINLALSNIRKAIHFGYDDFDFLERDKDLSNLRKDSRFLEYLVGVKNKKTENP